MTTHLSADVLTGIGPINARAACGHRQAGDRITGCIAAVTCRYCIAEINAAHAQRRGREQ